MKAVVFDMDGLMFDTERVAILAWDYAGEKMGIGKAGYMVYKTLGVNVTASNQIWRDEFGDKIFTPNGELDRRALAAQVFSDPEALERLNATVLPIVIERIRAVIRELDEKGCEAVIIDAPTLIESGFAEECDFVLSVSAPEDVRIERIMKRDGIDESRARARVCGQKGDEFYRATSDAFLYDEGDAEQLLKSAREAIGI